MANIRSYKELNVYQTAMECAVLIHELSKQFPAEEKYSLVDQIRRSSRSVCSNLAEAWRKRRYPKSFVNKLNDAEGEAEETRVWLEFSRRFGYLPESQVHELDDRYDKILGQLVRMAANPDQWTIQL
ncbi:MAG: four helix bundle protein [Chloroflexi bacterium]|nr:four helix bundle protein [Chloroflexota bacterium]MBP8058271.1 four helix bundle protein [Chloroflexota bacterium]